MDQPEPELFVARGKGLTIVLDRTDSMAAHLGTLQHFLAQYIVRRIADGRDEIDRLSLVLVDDHGCCAVPAVVGYGPTDNLEEFISWLWGAQEGQGGDLPEAIACALADAHQRDPGAAIWLVTDARPHHNGPRFKASLSLAQQSRMDEFCELCLRPIDRGLLEGVNVLPVGDDAAHLRSFYRNHGACVVEGDFARSSNLVRALSGGDPEFNPRPPYIVERGFLITPGGDDNG